MGNLIDSLKKFLSRDREKEKQENSVNLPTAQNNNNQVLNNLRSTAEEFKFFFSNKLKEKEQEQIAPVQDETPMSEIKKQAQNNVIDLPKNNANIGLAQSSFENPNINKTTPSLSNEQIEELKKKYNIKEDNLPKANNTKIAPVKEQLEETANNMQVSSQTKNQIQDFLNKNKKVDSTKPEEMAIIMEEENKEIEKKDRERRFENQFGKTVLPLKNFTIDDLPKLANTAINSIPVVVGNTVKGLAETQKFAERKTIDYSTDFVFSALSGDWENKHSEMSKELLGSTIGERAVEEDLGIIDKGAKAVGVYDWKNSSLEKITENQENMKTGAGKYLNELTPSLVQNGITIAASAINPTAAMVQFSASAMGGYYDDAKAKGLDDDQAFKYSAIMAGFETLTEKVISADALKAVKGIWGKEASKEIVESFGKQMMKSGVENFLQEAAMEPLDIITTNTVTGKKTEFSDIFNEDILKQSAKAGLAGTVSSILLGGASLGINSCTNTLIKMQNGKEVSINEVNEAINDAKSAGIDTKEISKQIGNKVAETTIEQAKNSKWQNVKSGLIDFLRGNNSNKNIAPVDENMYNNIKSKGEINEGNQWKGFRGLQEEARRELNTKSWNERKGQINEQLREGFSRTLSNELRNRGYSDSNDNGILKVNAKGNEFNLYTNVDGQTFRDIFEVARTYTENGELVDLHSVKDYENTQNYLSDDGLSGFAITKDGDLISVFNNSGKKGFLRAIQNEIKQNTKTLDCYASPKQDLQKIYEKVFGFKTASIMEYNIEYDHDSIAKNHNLPQVAFMVNTQSEVPTKYFTKDQYNEAVEYRNKFIDNGNNPNLQQNAINNEINPLARTYDNVRLSAEKFKDYFKSDEARSRIVESLEKIENIRNNASKNGKLQILFDDSVNGNGVIVNDGKGNRTIRINPNSEKAIEFVLLHELTHDIKNTKEYSELQDIISKYSSKEFNFEEAKRNLTEIYQEFYKKNNLDIENLDINEEATADVIGTLLGDQNFINQLSIQKPNVFNRLRNWINKQIAIYKSSDKEATRFLYDVKDKFEKALKSISQNYNTENIKYSVQDEQININGDRAEYIDQNKQKEQIYFRFDDENTFKGKEHQSAVSMWEERVDEMIYPDYDNQYSIEEVNEILKKYGTNYEEYSEMDYEEQLKIKREIGLDEGLITYGASVFELSEYDLELANNYLSNHGLEDYDKVFFLTGKENGNGADGETIIIPDKVIGVVESEKIADIITDFEMEDLTEHEKLKKIAEIINKKGEENKKYSQDTKGKWQEFLDYLDKKTGEKDRTYFENGNIVPVKSENVNNLSKKQTATVKDTSQEKYSIQTESNDDMQENRFEDITNVRIVDKRKKAPTFKSLKKAVKDTKDTFVQKVVNKLQPIDDLAKNNNNLELKYMADKSQGASGIGQYNIGKAQTDLNGRRIGKSLNEVFEPIKNSKLEKEFSEYMYLKHNSDREAVNRPIFGEDISSQRSNELAKKYEEKHPEFKKYAEDIYSYLKNETNLLVKAGMIDKGTADYLGEMYPNYVPVERVLDSEQNRKDDALTSGNGIKKATGGNADIMSIDEAIAARTMKLRRAIAYNDLIRETAKTLKNVKIEDGQAPLSGDFDINSLFDSENAPVQEIDGKYKALYFENGEGHQFEITKDLYDALKPSMVYDIENTLPLKVVQKASKLHRDMLTKFSLTFPIKNAIKDIQDVTLNSKYLSKFPKNYAKAIKEIATDGDLYNLYMANGGGNNTYFDYDTGIQKTKTKNPIKWSGEKIATINETIEQLPRLAEFISTLESGGSVNEALYNAADITTNFKRGGEIAKALNRNGATFLNASIQGFDKFYRNFSGQNGVKGYINIMAKATLFAMAPAVLNHLLYDDDEDYKDLRNSDKDLYYLFKYDDGKFIRIPKGRALSVFGTAARRVLNSYQGEDDAFDGMIETVSNQVAPNNPVTNNVIAPIAQAVSNKSWFGGDIVSSRLQKELLKNQYDESTDDFSIWLGQKLNISPKKINYVIDQYSGGVGDVLLPIMTKKASNKGNVFKEQFTTDSVLKNKNVGKFYDVIEEQTKIVNDSNSTDDDKLQLMYLNDVNDEVSSLYKKKREVQLSNMDNKEKSEKVREIQDEINTKMKDAISNYKNVKKVDDDIAKVKNTTYIKVEGKWKSLSNSDIDAIESVEKIGGKEFDYLRFKIDNTYTDSDGKVKSKSNAEKIEYINNNISSSKSKKALYISTVGKEDKTYRKFNGAIDTYLDYKVAINKKTKNDDKSLTNNEKIDVLLNSNFSNGEITDLYEASLLSDSDDLYQILKASDINIKEYLRYKTQDLSADKEDDGTVKGKSVSGSSKKKKYNYINSMGISYEQKLLLLGSQYKLTDNERTKLANYINGMNLSKKQKLEVYGKLKGFTVYKDGRVTW